MATAPPPASSSSVLLEAAAKGPPIHIYAFLDRKDLACVLPRLSKAFRQALAPETVRSYARLLLQLLRRGGE